jgi:hypothetical protein
VSTPQTIPHGLPETESLPSRRALHLTDGSRAPRHRPRSTRFRVCSTYSTPAPSSSPHPRHRPDPRHTLNSRLVGAVSRSDPASPSAPVPTPCGPADHRACDPSIFPATSDPPAAWPWPRSNRPTVVWRDSSTHAPAEPPTQRSAHEPAPAPRPSPPPAPTAPHTRTTAARTWTHPDDRRSKITDRARHAVTAHQQPTKINSLATAQLNRTPEWTRVILVGRWGSSVRGCTLG